MTAGLPQPDTDPSVAEWLKPTPAMSTDEAIAGIMERFDHGSAQPASAVQVAAIVARLAACESRVARAEQALKEIADLTHVDALHRNHRLHSIARAALGAAAPDRQESDNG